MRTIAIHSKLQLRMDEVSKPEPTGDQVLLHMAYAGICGSDLHYYYQGANGAFVVRQPLVPGHEVSGTVEVDPLGQLAPGTPVTVHPATFGTPDPQLADKPHLWPDGAYLGSASTWPHTQGGMAEYLIVNRAMIRVLPEGLPLRRAALAEPLAVSLHGLGVAGGVEGQRVLVSGAGPIGLLTAAAAIVRGAKEVVVTDVLPGPLGRAKSLGVTETIQIGQQPMPENYFDVALECSGAAVAISGAIAAIRRAGVIAQIGMLGEGSHPIAIAPLIAKEAHLRGCFRFNREIDEAVAMLAAHPWIERTITHVFPADRVIEAFEVARDSEQSGKVLVNLWRDELATEAPDKKDH